jgi:hypothetical protein
MTAKKYYAHTKDGEPRLTRDIGITLGVGADHLDKLLLTIE